VNPAVNPDVKNTVNPAVKNTVNDQHIQREINKMSAQYPIDCTGDAVVGDFVLFKRAVFEGSYRRPVFVENETVRAQIVKDSYGADRQQHTFTLKTADGKTFRVKGRNLYRNGTRRMGWPDESKRQLVQKEKHGRGEAARFKRRLREAGDQ
jgi:RNase P/RNase MRP subunit p29